MKPSLAERDARSKLGSEKERGPPKVQPEGAPGAERAAGRSAASVCFSKCVAKP